MQSFADIFPLLYSPPNPLPPAMLFQLVHQLTLPEEIPTKTMDSICSGLTVANFDASCTVLAPQRA